MLPWLRDSSSQSESSEVVCFDCWMAALPLNRSEPPSGSLEIIEELNRLKELRVIQRIEVMQQATWWACTRDNVMTPGAL